MPFTFAHPVAIIPIKNKSKNIFCLTGLVLGSIAPDFEYFIRLKPYSVYGHGLVAFFILNLPLCFLLAFIFHSFLKVPLVIHMPQPISNWLGTYIKPWNIGTLKKVIIFIYSALLGMLTHVIWDSFTHAEGVFVMLIPFLSTKISLFGYTVFLYKILQHGSTIFGMLIILVYLYIKRNPNSKVTTIPLGKKLLFYSIIILTSLVLIFGIIYIKTLSVDLVNIGSLVVIAIDCLFLGTLLSSLISRLWYKPSVV